MVTGWRNRLASLARPLTYFLSGYDGVSKRRRRSRLFLFFPYIYVSSRLEARLVCPIDFTREFLKTLGG